MVFRHSWHPRRPSDGGSIRSVDAAATAVHSPGPGQYRLGMRRARQRPRASAGGYLGVFDPDPRRTASRPAPPSPGAQRLAGERGGGAQGRAQPRAGAGGVGRPRGRRLRVRGRLPGAVRQCRGGEPRSAAGALPPFGVRRQRAGRRGPVRAVRHDGAAGFVRALEAAWLDRHRLRRARGARAAMRAGVCRIGAATSGLGGRHSGLCAAHHARRGGAVRSGAPLGPRHLRRHRLRHDVPGLPPRPAAVHGPPHAQDLRLPVPWGGVASAEVARHAVAVRPLCGRPLAQLRRAVGQAGTDRGPGGRPLDRRRRGLQPGATPHSHWPAAPDPGPPRRAGPSPRS
mmetsp:Transcript_26989/g.84794  ORF Transcript_26989/g.84794 Transcript_26989/m.84794 type:complete len:342 (-) Transcript_26989:229-1254(-)